MKLSDSTITSQMQKDLEILIETKITHVLGGRRSNANNDTQMRFKTAVYFLHDFYEYFNVSIYSEIKVYEYKTVNNYIMEWRASTNLRKEIDLKNIKERTK